MRINDASSSRKSKSTKSRAATPNRTTPSSRPSKSRGGSVEPASVSSGPRPTSTRALESASDTGSNPAGSRQLVGTQARVAANLTGSPAESRPEIPNGVTAGQHDSGESEPPEIPNGVTAGPHDSGESSEPAEISSGDAPSNTVEVEVVLYDGPGGSPNDTLETILTEQGHTVEELYATDENGETLISTIAEANNIEDPNLIHPGDTLTVPITSDDSVEPEIPHGVTAGQHDSNESEPAEIPHGVTAGQHDSGESEPAEIPQGVTAGQHDSSESSGSAEIPNGVTAGQHDGDPSAELTELTTNFNYLLDPTEGDANLNETATLDGGIADVANGDWNREGFVDEWSSSYANLHPDLSQEETVRMAEARADRFQSGAERVLGNDTLRKILHGGRDGRNRLDGEFHLSDVLVASELFSEEAGDAFNSLNKHREALSFFGQPTTPGVSIQSPQNGNVVTSHNLEQLASLADNEQFEQFLENESFSLEDWAGSDNARGSDILQSLQDGQSNIGEPLDREALDALVTAASYVTDNELLSFQYFNSADGNRGGSALSFDDLENLAAL